MKNIKLQSIEERLNEMQLGQTMTLGNFEVTAVPGGWIYAQVVTNPYTETAPAIAAVFVPKPN